jgi:protein TonB
MAEDIFNSWSQPESEDRLNMVFSGRFKEYGAFQVRSIYRKSKVIATIVACVGMALAAATPLIIEKISASKSSGKKIKIAITNLEDVKAPEEEEEKPKDPPKVQEPELVATQAYVAPRINENTTEEAPTEPVDDIRTAGKKTQAGSDDPFDGSSGAPDGTGNNPVVNNQGPATKVQIEAKFPGGPKAFEQFILDNFEYPERCKDEGIEGYVLLKFVVDLKGKISRIEPVEQNARCPEFTQEAIRVLKKSPPWIPAQNNGQFTIAWRQLPIKLSLGE